MLDVVSQVLSMTLFVCSFETRSFSSLFITKLINGLVHKPQGSSCLLLYVLKIRIVSLCSWFL